jgi:hypothetical protein
MAVLLFEFRHRNNLLALADGHQVRDTTSEMQCMAAHAAGAFRLVTSSWILINNGARLHVHSDIESFGTNRAKCIAHVFLGCSDSTRRVWLRV